MPQDAVDEVTPLTQEVRLATTMTGGVSLAIWMGGVARELNLLLQASSWRRSNLPPEQGAMSGPAFTELQLYRKLLGLLDILADVDILSGTSAGGINAILVAFARVQNLDLGAFRELWLDLGALTDLLREPTDTAFPSLMYGDERMLADLIAQLPRLPRSTAPQPTGDNAPSTSLFVTTTLLSGETSRFTDAMGTLVQDVDRHGVFEFDTADLADRATVPALALAGRSTASFPGAFEPSYLPFRVAVPGTARVPERPPVEKFMDTTRGHWAADGGLLDNQPLDLILQRVFDRKAQRPVRRVLLYVVPSTGAAPEVNPAALVDDVGSPLGLVESMLKDLSAVTGQSIAADLRAVREHNDRVQARVDGRLQLVALAARLGGGRLLDAGALAGYRDRQGQQVARSLIGALLTLLGTWPPEPADAGPDRGPTVPAAWRGALADARTEASARAEVASALTAAWTLPGDTLPDTPDAYARFGRAAFDGARAVALSLLRAAYALTPGTDDRTTLAATVRSVHAADVRRANGDPIDVPARPDPAALAEQTAGDAALRVGPWETALSALTDRYLAADRVDAGAWSALAGTLVGAAPLLAAAGQRAVAPATTVPATAVRTLVALRGYLFPSAAARAPADGAPLVADQVARRLFDLVITERSMLPIDLDADQPVELVQVSADTASDLAPGRHTAASKLTGMQLHHFGAFYKRSWRANDWMWGRIDGAGWLVHVLLDPRRIRTVCDGRDAAWFADRLAALQVTDGGPPPTVPAEVMAELAFLSVPDQPPPAGLPITARWLARAWQAEIAREEVPQVARAVGVGGPSVGVGTLPDLVRAADDLTQRLAGLPTVPKEVAVAGRHLAELARTTAAPSARPAEVDWSPPTSQAWARRVFSPDADLPALLAGCPVPDETFATDRSSPLMARTMTKALATTAAAVKGTGRLPVALRSVVGTVHTVTLGGYRVVGGVRGRSRTVILVGLVLLALGVAGALQSTTVVGIGGLALAIVGGYLVVLGTWQLSARLWGALVGLTVAAAVASLAVTPVRHYLFGTSATDGGWVSRNVHWLGASWWHPLVVVGLLALLVSLDALTITSWGARLGRTLRARRRPGLAPPAAVPAPRERHPRPRDDGRHEDLHEGLRAGRAQGVLDVAGDEPVPERG